MTSLGVTAKALPLIPLVVGSTIEMLKSAAIAVVFPIVFSHNHLHSFLFFSIERTTSRQVGYE